MAGPEYTKGKRSIDAKESNVVRADDPEDAEPWGLAEFDAHCGRSLEEPKGNARLSSASDNAVLELAEHLGCNAVELAERLEGGGLTEIAVALGTICAATEPGEDPDIGLLHRIASAALSHLTTAPR